MNTVYNEQKWLVPSRSLKPSLTVAYLFNRQGHIDFKVITYKYWRSLFVHYNRVQLCNCNVILCVTCIGEFSVTGTSEEVSRAFPAQLPIRRNLRGPLHQVDVRLDRPVLLDHPVVGGPLCSVVEDSVEDDLTFWRSYHQRRGCVQRVNSVDEPRPGEKKKCEENWFWFNEPFKENFYSNSWSRVPNLKKYGSSRGNAKISFFVRQNYGKLNWSFMFNIFNRIYSKFLVFVPILQRTCSVFVIH